MSSAVLSFCSFHIRRWLRAQPAMMILVACAVLLLVTTVLVLVQQWQQARSAQQQLHQLLIHRKSGTDLEKSTAPVTPAIPVLPPFSSAELVDTINQIVLDIGLPADEMSYALEKGAALPYLRYRVTLSVTANYPTMRRFIDQVAMSVPNAVLDSISCSREDIAVAALDCDLAFSAFFRKDGNG